METRDGNEKAHLDEPNVWMLESGPWAWKCRWEWSPGDTKGNWMSQQGVTDVHMLQGGKGTVFCIVRGGRQ